MDTCVFSVRFHFPFQLINFSLHPLSIILLFQSISSCSLYLVFFLALFLLSLSVSFSCSLLSTSLISPLSCSLFLSFRSFLSTYLSPSSPYLSYSFLSLYLLPLSLYVFLYPFISLFASFLPKTDQKLTYSMRKSQLKQKE